MRKMDQWRAADWQSVPEGGYPRMQPKLQTEPPCRREGCPCRSSCPAPEPVPCPLQPTPCEEMPPEPVPCEEMPPEPIPCEEMPPKPVPCEEIPSEPVPCEEMPPEPIPCEEMPPESIPCEEMPPTDCPCELPPKGLGRALCAVTRAQLYAALAAGEAEKALQLLRTLLP